MWTQATALLLMLTCCLWTAEGQINDGRKRSVWEDPVTFTTKANDFCTMIVTGQGDLTKLRVSCHGSKGAYWCDYFGKPNLCRPYNNNPRHYFVQMMWDLRKLHNACQGPKQVKPHMCRKASDETQMVFSDFSFSRSMPEAQPPATTRPDLASTEATETTEMPYLPERASAEAIEVTQRPYWEQQASPEIYEVTPVVETIEITGPQPDVPHEESDAKRMARQYCWRSLRGVCSFAIGLFRN